VNQADKMAPEQPKKPAGGAFGQFMNVKRADFVKQLPGKAVSEVSKLAGSTWKALSEAEKAPYQKKYEDAKAQYEKDFAAFIAAGGVKAKGAAALRSEKKKAKAGKKAKDPLKPKSPVGGAFGCFLNKHRPDFMKESQGQPITAITKLASTKWKALSEADRAPFEAEYQKKKAAYAEAMKSYVPPAGAAVEEESEDEDENEEDEEEEEEEGGKPSPPLKKAKTAEAPPAKKANVTGALGADILAEAKKKGLDLKLKALMQNPKMAEKKIDASAALKALEKADGKTVAAKNALLGA